MANPLVQEALALKAAVNDAALLLCQRRRLGLVLRLQQLRRQPHARQQGEELPLEEAQLERVKQALLAAGHMAQPLQQLPPDELEGELARLLGQLAAAEARMLAQLEPLIAVVARLAGEAPVQRLGLALFCCCSWVLSRRAPITYMRACTSCPGAACVVCRRAAGSRRSLCRPASLLTAAR